MTGTHPLTTYLRAAAEQIRQANHATHTDTRCAPELYDTLGALHDLLTRLPQLVTHLHDATTNTPAESCYHDHNGNVRATLDSAATHLTEARNGIDTIASNISRAWSQLGHLGTTTTPDG